MNQNPDPEASSREQFFGSLFPQDARFIELRALPSEHRIFVKPGNVQAIDHFIKTHSGEDIYFGVAERVDRNKGGGKDNCGLAGAVFCDCDFKSTPEKKIRKILHDFPLRPSIVVGSGGGFHVYYLLKEPVDLTQEGERYEGVLRRLATALCADKASAERARVLRVPGTLNYKPEYGTPREVRIVHFDQSRRYDLADFDDFLPADLVNSDDGRVIARDPVSPFEGPDTPGALFNKRAEFKQIMQSAGWPLVKTQREEEFYRRPDKTEGHSATANYRGSGKLKIFTSAEEAKPFEAHRTYTPFQAWTVLYFNGDAEAATKALVAAGFGDLPRGSLLPWQFWDGSRYDSWDTPPQEWDVEPVIPKRAIGFLAAPPKERKSLLAEDLALHLAQSESKLWLGKFKTSPRKVLYIAREDPAARLKERLQDICASYRMERPPVGRLQFVIREPLQITDDLHRAELIRQIKDNGFEFLVLDVLGRMTGVVEHWGKDVVQIVRALEDISFQTAATILCADHTRKPQGLNRGRDSQEPNPFDLFGDIRKYGLAEFMISLARSDQPGRLQVKAENKDHDEEINFWLQISPKGSSEPKFQYAGDVEKAAKNMRELGQQNRQKVLDVVLSGSGVSSQDVADKTGLSLSTAKDHLTALLKEQKITTNGASGRNTRYCRPADSAEVAAEIPEALRPNPVNDSDSCGYSAEEADKVFGRTTK